MKDLVTIADETRSKSDTHPRRRFADLPNGESPSMIPAIFTRDSSARYPSESSAGQGGSD